MKLAALSEFVDAVQRLHGLVELYATAKANPEQYLLPLTRGFGRLKIQFMGAGMDALSQLSGSMEIAAKRGLSARAKSRILREGVGSMRFQLELEQRAIISDDEAERRREDAEEQD